MNLYLVFVFNFKKYVSALNKREDAEASDKQARENKKSEQEEDETDSDSDPESLDNSFGICSDEELEVSARPMTLPPSSYDPPPSEEDASASSCRPYAENFPKKRPQKKKAKRSSSPKISVTESLKNAPTNSSHRNLDALPQGSPIKKKAKRSSNLNMNDNDGEKDTKNPRKRISKLPGWLKDFSC